MSEIKHLAGIKSSFVETDRLRMHLLTAGKSGNEPILFLHGNTTSATIWEEFMLECSDEYYCLAPDLRGFGQTDETQLIDATRGAMDWVDDITALAGAVDIGPFHLVGHSLGGFVCWGVMAHHADALKTVTLMAPGPPVGFGGLRDEKGLPNNEDFSGSGAGIVVDAFAERISEKDRSSDDPFYSPRNAMNRLFWKEGFRANREEDLLTAMLNIHCGERKYPGDFISSEYWPGVAPGRWGPVNAMSPKYNQTVLKELRALETKPPVLWIQGTEDHIISDQSFSDPGFQGKLGLREDWPGAEQFPPQPLASQVRYTLQQYKAEGGSVCKKFIDDCGHSPFMEKPEVTRNTFLAHLKKIKSP